MLLDRLLEKVLGRLDLLRCSLNRDHPFVILVRLLASPIVMPAFESVLILRILWPPGPMMAPPMDLGIVTCCVSLGPSSPGDAGAPNPPPKPWLAPPKPSPPPFRPAPPKPCPKPPASPPPNPPPYSGAPP